MYLVNISIDDVTPHPQSSTKVLKTCEELISLFPLIKFTLFIPAAYWRTVSQATEKPLFLSDYPDFCDEIRSLSPKNYEIGLHGFYHGIINQSNNDEFRDLNYKDAYKLFELMEEIAKKTNLQFKKIFRPPAWRMSPEAIKAAKDFGIEILALSPDKYPDGSLDYKNEDKKFKNVVYYNCNPPWKNLDLYPKTEIVYHASEWDKNQLNEKSAESLTALLEPERDNIKFCFMEDML